MSVRVYIPATLADLAAYVRSGEVPADVARLTAPGETEDAEYATLMEAADASRDLLAGPGKRVVVVAEVGRADAAVPMDRVVAVHVDVEDDADEDDDLAWYATQEIPDLISTT
jgi:uncharacterized protein DUF6912